MIVVRTGLEPVTSGVTGRHSKPTELTHHFERVSRIELPSLAWEANALTVVLYPQDGRYMLS